MFKKYTVLAASLLLATAASVSSAECINSNGAPTFGGFFGSNAACVSTCQNGCTTFGCNNSTCSHLCATFGDCTTTCGTNCCSNLSCEPTVFPPAMPTVQPTQQPSATQAPSTGDDYTTQSVSAQEQKMANLLNADRNSNGLDVLTLDPELCRIARIKSADMRDNNYFAHESPTYGRVGEMLKRFGYAYAAAGENIAHHANVDKAQAAFMSSAGHRANILGSWTKVGIGIVTDANGYIYATQIFAR